MVDFGMKISRDGEEVTTALEKDLLFTTKNNVLKLAVSRKDTVAAGATLTIAHGFAWIPMYMMFVLVGGTWRPQGFSGLYTSHVNGTNVLFFNGSGASVDVRTFIFADKLA
jgi:hypothetical protein